MGQNAGCVRPRTGASGLTPSYIVMVKEQKVYGNVLDNQWPRRASSPDQEVHVAGRLKRGPKLKYQSLVPFSPLCWSRNRFRSKVRLIWTHKVESSSKPGMPWSRPRPCLTCQARWPGRQPCTQECDLLLTITPKRPIGLEDVRPLALNYQHTSIFISNLKNSQACHCPSDVARNASRHVATVQVEFQRKILESYSQLYHAK